MSFGRVVVLALLNTAMAGMAGAETSACEASEDELRPALESRYASMKVAMETRDRDAIAALLAPDFFSEDVSGGSTTGQRMIEGVMALPVDPHRISATTTLLSTQLIGSVAVVEQRYRMETVKAGADGGKHRFELVAVSTDQWICSGAVWLWQKTTTNQMDVFLDGRAVRHEVRRSY